MGTLASARWSKRIWMRARRYQQTLRFAVVGVLNSAIDILILNLLTFCFPTRNVGILLAYSILAYSLGTLNSFLWNKYWTFQRRKRITAGELLRFAAVTLIGIAVNSILFWGAVTLLHPFIADARILANTAKIFAVIGTAVISYLGMRLWVFTHTPHQADLKEGDFPLTSMQLLDEQAHGYSEPASAAKEAPLYTSSLSEKGSR